VRQVGDACGRASVIESGLVGRIHERVSAARRRLLDVGISPHEASLDARLLAGFTLGWDAARFLASSRDPEPAGFAEAYDRLVGRRERREPIAYITGEREFWNRAFAVSSGVLIPRPETELIVEAALELRPPARVADIGTGTGCLAITLACERPSARMVATDVSEAALAVARDNAGRHGVSSAIAFAHVDLLDEGDGTFDLIVSNPPYVPDGARASLPPEVRDFEPAAALFAGPDGLDVVARIIASAPRHLAPGGSLVVEIGAGQADAVSRLISNTVGLTMAELRRDLQGIPRVLVAHRS
jgi:release factor glutamine methyltransferase